jgi:hypothetical protein
LFVRQEAVRVGVATAAQLMGLVAAVAGALCLRVLTVNSALLIGLGLSQAPGELPIWVPLLAFTTGAAVMLCRGNASGGTDR